MEKYKVVEDLEDFVLWKEIENNPNIEVFIEDKVVPELEQKEVVNIDAVVGESIHGTVGMLFIKNQTNMYGSGC